MSFMIGIGVAILLGVIFVGVAVWRWTKQRAIHGK